MIKVYQNLFGKEGNCFEACLASILEVSIEEIPRFDDENGRWYSDYKKWFRERGYDLLMLRGDSWVDGGAMGLAPKVYVIVSGTSSRGLPHATVYFGHEMVHDPHPQGGGVKNITDWIYVISKYPKLEKKK